MYVCMCVCNPPLRSRAAASVAKGCSEGEWAQRRPGGVPLGDKAKTKKRQGSRVAPGPRVSAARARAAPSPGRVSSRAPVGAVLAATLRGFLLGVVPGAPPGLPTPAGPGYNSRRTAQGGGWAGTSWALEGGSSAPGLCLPPGSQCVARPGPDSPHCLDRFR